MSETKENGDSRARVNPVHVIGGGLAGCEAAWQLARAAVPVVLHEMRPLRATPAHVTDQLAELVCSNSFRSDDLTRNAVGLLHEEMRRCDSLILQAGDAHRVPAGGALAVDRVGFAAAVQRALEQEPLVSVQREEVASLPPAEWDSVIIATGPLTSPALAEAIRVLTGEEALAFFDAIAPIVYRESIDLDKAWFQSRYDKHGPGGDGRDYINCPLDREQYTAFIQAILAGEKMPFRDWEKDTPYFEGCLPIEVMAERGPDTLAFGPMKPVGLTDPRTGTRPHAVVQLRQDNALGTLYNMVGFQTKLKHADQVRIFRMIPGLETAQFARLGGIHRNTFLHSPKLLDRTLRLRTAPYLRFAGQITGVEGYIESAAMGLLAGRFAAAERNGQSAGVPPTTTALGALLAHLTGGANADTFQPMNVNYGLFPPLAAAARRQDRKRLYAERALTDLAAWLGRREQAAAE
ncbi:MAG: methylenetetrahydrofolate--tRNA-(uracil(54)-C(5))-methyltransferase (FADH(2)-oxidizing) TrmFO [Alphaproteobacteria bacterium]|nr:methylenetetrahydrofolate--tRNA-(uracil(54)-C(5))-methyltransferase (FADH(2)-oxidizing) TrmFO [Alphaproteobacteria bacterium]